MVAQKPRRALRSPGKGTLGPNVPGWPSQQRAGPQSGPTSVLVEKASERRLPSQGRRRRFCSPQGEFPWWKAPRVRLSVLSFRGEVRRAALQGVPSASEVHRADSFGNEAHTAGPSSHVDSSRGATRTRDRRCPGLSGWGKSTAASGRRGGGRRGPQSQVTPDLRKPGR
jgi:hypothetical protein